MRVTPWLMALLAFAVTSPVRAVVSPDLPDAGRLSREQQAPVAPPEAGEALTLPAPGADAPAPGGLQVTLAGVSFTGNTVFDDEQLRAVLGEVRGRAFDLRGLHDLAERITAYYRTQGYAYAQAFLPAGGLRGGALTIQVVEGSLGRLQVSADTPARASQAEAFLADLRPGEPMRADRLNGRLLLLGEQPGYRMLPVMRPGRQVGTGDLDVQLDRLPALLTRLNLSNQGSRYTGYQLARVNVAWRSPFRFGDQLSADLMQSDKGLQSASLAYALPVGGSGLRANISYNQIRYALAREFAALDARGQNRTLAAGLSYPLLRSNKTNLTLSLNYQRKRLFDEQLAVAASQRKGSDGGVLSLNFDRRDDSGITYGLVSLTSGRFALPAGSPDPGLTRGRFSYVSADVVRLQRLMQSFSLYLRVNGQATRDNLDSSESFILGGPYAVRAFPGGEGNADEGVLTQIELRYNREGWQPFLFFDAGRARLEHDVTAPGKNSRALSGAGLGVRYQREGWSVDAVMARRLVGGTPLSDPDDALWRFWLSLGYQF